MVVPFGSYATWHVSSCSSSALSKSTKALNAAALFFDLAVPTTAVIIISVSVVTLFRAKHDAVAATSSTFVAIENFALSYATI
jgi:hypothetical protein